MADESVRLKILDMIDSGQISASEGIKLLEALTSGPDELPEPPSPPIVDFSGSGGAGIVEAALPKTEPAAFQAQGPGSQGAETPFEEAPLPEEPEAPPRFDPASIRWRSWWWIPMWVGVGITILGGALMFWAYQANGFGFWFACTWFPFLLGVLVMALAWASRRARWLHLRIHQKPGDKPERIAISMPIPLRLTAWFLRIFKNRIPNLGNTGVDELILALDKTSPDAPFYVEVNEGANGERVEVYIG